MAPIQRWQQKNKLKNLPWPIEEQITTDVVEAALSLEPRTALFLVVTYFVHQILHILNSSRLFASRAIPSIDCRTIRRVSPTRATPRCHATRTEERKFISPDLRATMPASQQDG